MNIMIIRNTTGNSLRSITSSKIIIFIILIVFLIACTPDKSEISKAEGSDPIDAQDSERSPVLADKPEDRTEVLYAEIKDLFSGSWMDDYDVIDGERDVSWGIVPYSNSYYFIIDFQHDNYILISGASEGGKEGFDSYIGEVFKIEEEEAGLYRFSYKNTISTRNPNRTQEIVLRYNAENDTMAIIGYGDNVYENPSEMIRISEPLHK